MDYVIFFFIFLFTMFWSAYKVYKQTKADIHAHRLDSDLDYFNENQALEMR